MVELVETMGSHLSISGPEGAKFEYPMVERNETMGVSHLFTDGPERAELLLQLL